ncbi:hypothetical protein AB6O49_34280 [Streptomyces sp. SBR177]
MLWWAMSSEQGLVETIRGGVLATEGRSDEAVERAATVVANARRMAELNPAVHGRHLALALSTQGSFLWEAGRRTEAVGPLLESLHLYRQLAEVSPAERRALPEWIDAVADRLIELDRHAEAVVLVEELLALQRSVSPSSGPRTARRNPKPRSPPSTGRGTTCVADAAPTGCRGALPPRSTRRPSGWWRPPTPRGCGT